MKVFIFGQKAKQDDYPHISSLISHLKEDKAEIYIFDLFFEQIMNEIPAIRKMNTWSGYSDLMTIKPDSLITMGGDGTILSALTYVRDSQVPILGINLGRLGFLASIEKRYIADAAHFLNQGMYELEQRSLIQLDCNFPVFGETPFALNDFSILKRDNSSMITIHTYINGDFLNSYWADGLIISTPTGSTGYSLSCGGPILFPQARNLVITPVAPHNLNVRPVVLSDDAVLSFQVEGRTDNFLCTLDSRYEVITAEFELAVRKCDFNIQLIQLQPSSFSKTMHDKLNWGLDQRN
ncbi:MAG: NAD kinase [Saprospiraceae bacterium]|nr:NAD kinase [Saprospiraceae bacterium]MBK8485719.1 NAD kinase [Saprospiraceae bacterium]MBK9222945.1 NAD kinase [Saprospiraceae bacterium]MBK9720013.1 NAD kinase [Saprospiraceae bacterium]MBK9726994.1 NAD kinase [Saprospiraceae bacterium]